MPVNDFHIQVATAHPGAEKKPSPKGRTLRTDISTGQDRLVAHIKLLSIEDIAKEAICAVLAKIVHLPILQAYYVNIDSTNLEDCSPGNIHNIAFGLQEDNLPAFRLASQQLNIELINWPESLRCAVFDQWIANGDRYPHNLLFAGNRHFWLIDHDGAFPSYVSPTAPVKSDILALLATNKSEFELYELRKKSMKYVEQYQSIDWNEIYELLLPTQLPGGSKYFKKYIQFLKIRTDDMQGILTQALGIRQKELELANPNQITKETQK
ncbi:MAG: HipA family kinase [Pseudomonadales bacterium]